MNKHKMFRLIYCGTTQIDLWQYISIIGAGVILIDVVYLDLHWKGFMCIEENIQMSKIKVKLFKIQIDNWKQN